MSRIYCLRLASFACAILMAGAEGTMDGSDLTSHRNVNYPWAVAFSSSSGQDEGRAITLDNAENVYIGGLTYGNLFDRNSIGGANSESFVARLNSADGRLIWADQPQSSFKTTVEFLACQGEAVYSIGVLSSSSSPTNADDIDIVSRATSDGTVNWWWQIGSDEEEGVSGLIADSTGIYIAGYTMGSLYESNAGGRDAVLVKVSPEGKYLWKHQFGEEGEDFITKLEFHSNSVVQVWGYSMNLYDWSPIEFTATYDRSSGGLIHRSDVQDLWTFPTQTTQNVVTSKSAQYSIGGTVNVRVIKNSCLGGTRLSDGTSSDVSCVKCQVASYSEDYADRCYSCPAGTSSDKGSAHCFDCEAGLYSNSGEPCTPCPQLKWSLSGEESCDFYTWRTTAGTGTLYFYRFWFIAGIILISSLLYLLALPVEVSVIILISAFNIMSDHLYVATGVYSSPIYLYMCLAFVILPGFHFVYYVLRAYDPTKQFKLRYLVKQPMLQAPLWKISVGKDSLPQWAGSERAANTTPSSSTAIDNANPGDDIAGAAAGAATSQAAISEAVFDAQIAREASSPLPSPEMGTLVVAWAAALLRQLLYSVGWAVFHAVYFTPWYLLHGLFYTFFWILGFYLYQSKVLYVKKVEVWWMAWVFGQGPVSEIWPATCAADSSVCLQDINAALLAEVLLESFPEFALQFANNISMQSWPVIAMVSTISSGLSIVLFLVRVTYWHVWMRLSISQMPLWNALESHMMMWLSDEEEGDIITAKDSSGALLLSDGQANDSAAFEMTSKLNAQKEMNLQLLKEKEEMKQKLSFLERVMASRRHNGTHGGGGYSAALGHDDEDDDQTATNFAAAVVTSCAAESGELEEEDADLDELLL